MFDIIPKKKKKNSGNYIWQKEAKSYVEKNVSSIGHSTGINTKSHKNDQIENW